MTDMEQKTVYSWLSYPFGKQYLCNGSEYNDFRFTGKKFDDHTGLYYFGARYYMPEIGRFITPDPVAKNNSLKMKKPIALNLYSYCRDNPTKYVDPDGRDVYTKEAMREYVADAYRRSSTFRDLYDALRQNRQVIVVIKAEIVSPWDKVSHRGKTEFKGTSDKGIRFIDCFIVSTEDESSKGNIAGHELVHATEIAENEEIVTREDYIKYQADMVKEGKAKFFQAGWCTYRARRIHTQIYNEIINDINGEDDVSVEDKEIFKPSIE